MTPEQELQMRLDLLEEECQQLKEECQQQRMVAYQLEQRLNKLEKRTKTEREEEHNPWEGSGLL